VATPLFFSAKCNPDTRLLETIARMGVGVEVATEGELRKSLAAGVSPDRIVVNGVSKTVSYLREALQRRVRAIVIDSSDEWRMVQSSPVQSPPVLLLRVNYSERDTNQFGFALEDALALLRATQQSQAGFPIAGFHIYSGGGRVRTDQIEPFLSCAERAIELGRGYLREPPIVALGLGLGVPYVAEGQAVDQRTATSLSEHLRSRSPWRDVTLWSEAGRYLVASAVVYATRVLQEKTIGDKWFGFVDGGLHTHNPGVSLGALPGRNPQVVFFRQMQTGWTRLSTGDMKKATLVGRLCTPLDTLARDIHAPFFREGDLVVIPNAGAYCETTRMAGFHSMEGPGTFWVTDDEMPAGS
jgi:diaminopimelate decarboxylase